MLELILLVNVLFTIVVLHWFFVCSGQRLEQFNASLSCSVLYFFE